MSQGEEDADVQSDRSRRTFPDWLTWSRLRLNCGRPLHRPVMRRRQGVTAGKPVGGLARLSRASSLHVEVVLFFMISKKKKPKKLSTQLCTVQAAASVHMTRNQWSSCHLLESRGASAGVSLPLLRGIYELAPTPPGTLSLPCLQVLHSGRISSQEKSRLFGPKVHTLPFFFLRRRRRRRL